MGWLQYHYHYYYYYYYYCAYYCCCCCTAGTNMCGDPAPQAQNNVVICCNAEISMAPSFH